MEKEIKIIHQCRCYTRLSVDGKEHVVPTKELYEWIEYFKEKKDER